MRLVMLIAVLLMPAQLAAQNVRTLAEGETSPPATIDQVAWIAGNWRGTGLGGDNYEAWSPPAGGNMLGSYHHIRDGETRFYEILQILPRDGSLVFRLRHFNLDLTGWEDETRRPLEFPLVAIEGDTAYFDGLTLERREDGGLTIWVIFNQPDGTQNYGEFVMHRIDPLAAAN